MKGVSFVGMLAILFIGLKLAGIIAWSWLWVLSPLWLPTTVMLAVAAVFFVVGVIGTYKANQAKGEAR